VFDIGFFYFLWYNIFMKFKIINDLNLKAQAEGLGVKIWQTPSFLFLVMGVIIVVAMTGVYKISRIYDNPQALVMAEAVVVIIIFIIGNSIIREIEEMAKLNKAKSEFISIASHQLRTPLSAIRWQIEIFLKKYGRDFSGPQRESIQGIERLSGRMNRLVNDLLNATRIDQKRLYLKKEDVDLAAVVREILEEIQPLAKAKKTEIIFESGENLPAVQADRERLSLAVENLLSNAVKYTAEQGKIEVNLKKDGSEIIFSVHDNGVGIPEKQQERIFEKFFRSDNVLKYQTEGTGLGLYIAKNIIEQTGGRIWFESRENSGTTFAFSIPINKQ